MTSSIAADIVSSIDVLRPIRTSTLGYSTVPKPSSSALIWCTPGSSPRKRTSPLESVTKIIGAPMPLTVTVTPGSRAPSVSNVVDIDVTGRLGQGDAAGDERHHGGQGQDSTWQFKV